MKFLKKALPLCLLALALVICVTLLAPKAEAATVESGTCGTNLKWTLDDAGTLTISGTGAMKNYGYDRYSPTYSTHPWKNVATSIKSVVIEPGVTSIGNYAFYNCESLASITIPDSITSIGDDAFQYCSNLTGIWVDTENPNYCSDDHGVLFNKDMTTLIVAPGGIDSAYTIPDSVTSIGNYAFYCCSSLTSITIPDSVTSIGDDAFSLCSSLTSITIPDSVTSIGNYAFAGCSSLTSITIPDSVTSIGDDAFQYCSSLTSITIGDSVTSIGSSAFKYCSSLTSVTIGDGVTSIGDYAFYSCKSLTSITIPDSVTSIGEYAFYRCSSLTEVTIPAGMKKIGDYAFYDCSSLKTVYYGGSQTQWSSISFGIDNSALTKATIHYNHIHDYTLLPAVTVEPTCTQAGYIEYTCMYGETYREALPAFGHDYSVVSGVVEPTCTERGYTESACSRCGVTGKTDYVPALGHDFSGTINTVEPTCTEQGYTQTQCIRCEATEKNNYIDNLGHSMVVVQLKDATCTEEGVSKVGTMCERCGTVFVQPTYTPALGHDYAGGTCSRCGEADPDYVLPETVTGDLDGDNAVSNNDVSLLLWHTLFPEEYPIENGDLTGDGEVNNNDVVLLLWHTLFPEEYPL